MVGDPECKTGVLEQVVAMIPWTLLGRSRKPCGVAGIRSSIITLWLGDPERPGQGYCASIGVCRGGITSTGMDCLAVCMSS